MARYVPTVDEVNQLSFELREILNDYVLMAMFNGISSPDDMGRQFFSMLNGLEGDEDLCRERPFLTMQRKEGVNTARSLLKVLGEIADVLATDLLGAEDAWPRWVNVRWEYSGVHERFKPLRELARVWKIDLTALVNFGRPRGSVNYPTPESIVAWLGPHIRDLRKEHKHPSQGKVAEAAGLTVDGMMYHVGNHFKWTELLAAVKGS